MNLLHFLARFAPPLVAVFALLQSASGECTVEGRVALPAKKSAPVATKDLGFVPALLAVQTGTRVEFPNEDDTYHNIFSYSPVKRFDLGRYRKDEKPIPSVLFDKAGLITLRCDIHEHMRGLILVLDTAHFVVTDADGHFRLTHLPAGHLTVKAWVDSRTTKAQVVDLKEGATARVDFP
jgi:plastocyanin